MAHMYPPEGPSEDCQSAAERDLYKKLRDALDDDWYIFHSVQWNTTGSNGRMRSGEADFVAVNRRLHVIIVIEVKGGRIAQGSRKGWYSEDGSGRKHPIQDPFKQALRSEKVLEPTLATVPATKPFAGEYQGRICHGVWFPDIIWPRDGRGALQQMDLLVCDRADAADAEGIKAALLRLTVAGLGTDPVPPFSEEAIVALIGLLFPDFSTIESPLADEMRLDESVIAHLTTEQAARMMAMWQHNRQMAIPGYAGTGKTVIALEMAWRLAKMGNRALFVCANNTLAAHLRQRVQVSPHSQSPGFNLDHFQIRSVEELVEDIAERVQGIAGEKRANVKALQQLSVTIAADQVKMADLTKANLDLLAHKDNLPVYDALLVDEAQDINQPLWPVLRRLLREPDDADEPTATCLYVFYDPAQRDLPGEWDPAWTGIDVIHEPLVVNCRNTEMIYGVMSAFNPLLRDIPFHGPLGRPVIYRDPATEAPATGDPVSATLSAVLTDLIDRKDQPVRPEQIIVITGRSVSGQSKRPTRWRLSAQQQLGAHSLEPLREKRSDTRIALTTIRSSKGLESPVVILAELDGIAQDAQRDRLLYIAVSRAKHQLIVLGAPAELQPTRQSRWRDRFFGRGVANHSLPPTTAPMLPAQVADGDAFIGPSDPDEPADAREPDGAPDGPDLADLADQADLVDAHSALPPASAPALASAPPKKQSKQNKKNKQQKQPAAQAPASPTGHQAAAAKTFQPSSHQQAIFEHVRKGAGDAIVRAVAGSGKTTTLVEAARLINSRNSLFLAFTNHTAKSLGQRLRGAPMSARTFHSAGLQTLKRFWIGDPEPTVDPDKYLRISQDWVRGHLNQLDPASQQQAAETLKLLADMTRATLTNPSDLAALRLMALHFGVESGAVSRDQLLQALPDVLARGDALARSSGGNDTGADNEDAEAAPRHTIDYMDMVYLPHAWNLPGRWQADWVFVDDAQDLNAAQLELARKSCGSDGHLLVVGDPHQAIYGSNGSNGADGNMLQRILQAKPAVEFRLPICYRCPTSHVALARQFAPEMEPWPGAPEGSISDVLLTDVVRMARKGDLIVSRKIAPLMDLCIQLVGSGASALVRGHDIGAQLVRLVEDVTQAPGFDHPHFEQWLDTYERRQIATLQQAAHSERADQPGQADAVEAQLMRLQDRVAAVRVCFQRLHANNARELGEQINALFRDDQPDVTLSTIHRARRLEANRVFLLDPNEAPLQWPNQQEWETEQERHLAYVALTRAKQQLYLVKKATS